jgi:hypothetical protein
MPGPELLLMGAPRQMIGWLRTHWRGVAAGLLASVATTAGVIAGLSTTQNRLLWLIGAGASAGLAVLLSPLAARHQIERERPDGSSRQQSTQPGSTGRAGARVAAWL